MALQYPSSLIDMHTHMFNADYLPLRGIFWSRGVPDPLNGWLARLAWALTKTSKFPDLILTPLDLESHAVSALKTHETLGGEHGHDPEMLDQYIEVLADNGAKLYLHSQLDVGTVKIREKAASSSDPISAELDDLFADIHSEFGDLDSAADLNLEMKVDSRFKAKPLSGESKAWAWSWGAGLRRMLRRFLKKAMRFVEKAVDLIDFVWNMTKREKELLVRLQNYYATRNIPFILVHYMMDMQFPYQKARNKVKDGTVKVDFYRDKKNRPSQLSQMRDLAKQSQGTLLGFSAFDPVRFLESGSSAKDIKAHLDKAMEAEMLGFKFYPPLGFRAAENDIPGMDYVVDVFLDYCVENDIPVFTHCTPEGFEISPNAESGLNAHPKYWRAALEKSEARRDLRLCLGHAGGGRYRLKSGYVSHGWIAKSSQQWEDEDNFAKHVVDLCREFPNVYCELANIETILDQVTHRENLHQNLIARLSDEADVGTYSLQRKIMYGTDWHMVGMVNDVIKYFDVLVSIFNDSSLIDMMSAFFRDNAIEFLKQSHLMTEVENNFPANFQSTLLV